MAIKAEKLINIIICLHFLFGIYFLFESFRISEVRRYFVCLSILFFIFSAGLIKRSNFIRIASMVGFFIVSPFAIFMVITMTATELVRFDFFRDFYFNIMEGEKLLILVWSVSIATSILNIVYLTRPAIKAQFKQRISY